MLEGNYTDALSSCQAFYHNILIFHTMFTQHIVFREKRSIPHFHLLWEDMESGKAVPTDRPTANNTSPHFSRRWRNPTMTVCGCETSARSIFHAPGVNIQKSGKKTLIGRETPLNLLSMLLQVAFYSMEFVGTRQAKPSILIDIHDARLLKMQNHVRLIVALHIDKT